jgi:hypothetical protein
VSVPCDPTLNVHEWRLYGLVLRDGAATTVAANAANAIDQFCTDYVNNIRKATPTAEAVRAQIAANPGIFMNLLTFIFQLVVFDDTAHQWTLSRALLAVILAAELVRPDVRSVCLLLRSCVA